MHVCKEMASMWGVVRAQNKGMHDGDIDSDDRPGGHGEQKLRLQFGPVDSPSPMFLVTKCSYTCLTVLRNVLGWKTILPKKTPFSWDHGGSASLSFGFDFTLSAQIPRL